MTHGKETHEEEKSSRIVVRVRAESAIESAH